MIEITDKKSCRKVIRETRKKKNRFSKTKISTFQAWPLPLIKQTQKLVNNPHLNEKRGKIKKWFISHQSTIREIQGKNLVCFLLVVGIVKDK
jgi:hypothetical protein